MINEITITGDKQLAELSPMLARAQELCKNINNDEQYTIAGELMSAIKLARKNIEKILRPFVDSSHKKWKDDLAELNKYDKPLAEAIELLNRPLAEYDLKKEQERIAEQARIMAENKKKAEEEALAKATELANSGHKEAAEELISQPTIIPPTILPSTAPKVNGMSFVDYWSAEVTNFPELVRAVASGRAPMSALLPNESFLNTQARSLKKEFDFPGVAARCERKPKNR